MRAKNGLWVVALALLSFLAVLNPHQAHAQSTSTTTMCTDGSVDTNFQNQRSANAQGRFNLAHNINTMFPLIPALNKCTQNIMNIFSKLPGLADPLNVVGGIVSQMILSVVNQVCSQIMGTITQAENAISQMAKICLPLPKFNLQLDLPTFSAQSCSGGTPISLITGFSSATPTTYSYSQFQSH